MLLLLPNQCILSRLVLHVGVEAMVVVVDVVVIV